jgi:hypothetical protein
LNKKIKSQVRQDGINERKNGDQYYSGDDHNSLMTFRINQHNKKYGPDRLGYYPDIFKQDQQDGPWRLPLRLE